MGTFLVLGVMLLCQALGSFSMAMPPQLLDHSLSDIGNTTHMDLLTANPSLTNSSDPGSATPFYREYPILESDLKLLLHFTDDTLSPIGLRENFLTASLWIKGQTQSRSVPKSGFRWTAYGIKYAIYPYEESALRWADAGKITSTLNQTLYTEGKNVAIQMIVIRGEHRSGVAGGKVTSVDQTATV